MSQITLNKFFDIPPRGEDEQAVAGLSVDIPMGRIFVQLPESAAKLQNLSQRAEELQALQSRLQDATTHQTRDRIIACIAGAVMVGLVAGIVLGTPFCLPVAIASIITLSLLGLVSDCVAVLWAEKDYREGGCYKSGARYAGFLWGIPILMSHLLTRKNALQNKVDPLQLEVKTDLLEAGQYLQQHIPAIREKLQNDIAALGAAIEQAANWQLPIQIDLDGLHKARDNSRTLLAELNEKGQPMVDRMIHAGILPVAVA